MQPAVLIRLRPAGPWRYGPGEGGSERIDALFRSDRLYSAITLAMERLGVLEEWLDATARAASPAVAFTSLFPFQGTTLFVTPPFTLWPPPAGLLTTPNPVFLSKIRWKAARFVPVTLVESIVLGQSVLADQWLPDPESGCLLRRDRPNSPPFHTVLRSGGAVDRISQNAVSVHTAACVEFEPGAGLWTISRYRDEDSRAQWADRVSAAIRLLADSGFGGRRSSGWGQTEAPEFQEGAWPDVFLPKLGRFLTRSGRAAAAAGESLHWALSLFAPSSADKIDWNSGDYLVTMRGGYVEDLAASGARKKQTRMVVEGSVLSAANDLVGAAVDVAPDGFAHRVYRSGLAVFLRLPVIEASASEEPAETSIESQVEPESEPETESGITREPKLEPETKPEPEPVETFEEPSDSVELVEESQSGFEPELPSGVSSEVEPQETSEHTGSMEDAESGKGGPDDGI